MNQHEPDNTALFVQSIHKRVKALLPEYLALQGSDMLYQPGWSEFKNHLLACPECRSEFEELRQILDDTYTGALQSTGVWQAPDFSFLQHIPHLQRE